MKRAIPFLIKDGVSVGETWITSEVVCFMMRSHGTRMRALPTASTASAIVFGGEEDRWGERRPGLWCSGRTECFLRIIFRGGALLGGIHQTVIEWGIIVYSIALGPMSGGVEPWELGQRGSGAVLG